MTEEDYETAEEYNEARLEQQADRDAWERAHG